MAALFYASMIEPTKNGKKTMRNKLLFGLLALAMPAAPALADGDFEITWYTIDSGGTTFSAAGEWTLAGTVGQFEATQAEALTGGDWQLTGGFWAADFQQLSEPAIFRDRFEE
jgi:hypothetical protein